MWEGSNLSHSGILNVDTASLVCSVNMQVFPKFDMCSLASCVSSMPLLLRMLSKHVVYKYPGIPDYANSSLIGSVGAGKVILPTMWHAVRLAARASAAPATALVFAAMFGPGAAVVAAEGGPTSSEVVCQQVREAVCKITWEQGCTCSWFALRFAGVAPAVSISQLCWGVGQVLGLVSP